jgi:hypothetical protein
MEVDYEAIRKKVTGDSESVPEGNLLETKEPEGES